ncbi:hypothetical protein D3C76_1816790 [compost metagenome]
MTAKPMSIRKAVLYDPPEASTRKPISIGVRKPASWAPVLTNPLAVAATVSGIDLTDLEMISVDTKPAAILTTVS